ncbi:MAG TPA: DUF222 domain-containing protein [Streptosporangiaceae bacterium]
MPPGPALALLLGAQECDRLDDFDVVEVARSARRLASWAASLELGAIAELSARRKMQGQKLGAWDFEVGEWVSDEVAAALTLSGGTAAHLVVMAQQLTADLPLTFRALREGLIDAAKARVIADGLRPLRPQVAADVERRVLPAASDQTCAQLRSAVRKAVEDADPDGCAERRRLAEEARCLELWENDQATSDLSGRNLPAAAASAAWNRVNAIAAALKADGDDRTIDQLRADVFVALLRNERPDPPHAPGSHLPPGPAGPSDRGWPGSANGGPPPADGGPPPGGATGDGPLTQERAPGGRRPLARTAGDAGDAGVAAVAAVAAAAVAVAAGEVRASGGVAALGRGERASCGSEAGRWTTLGHRGGRVDPDDAGVLTFRRQPDLETRAATGSGAEDRRAEDDHRAHAAAASLARMGAGAEEERAVAAAVAAAVRERLTEVTDGLARDRRRRRGQPALVTETLQRIKAATAELNARWCTITTNPKRKALRHGAGSYQVPAGMRRWLDARDVTCRFPGCRRRAARCDADHTQPHHLGGVTCPCNLAILCRRHHRLKQRPEWQLIQVWHGVLVWIAPTGHCYVVGPGP